MELVAKAQQMEVLQALDIARDFFTIGVVFAIAIALITLGLAAGVRRKVK